ncbi:MAG: ATP-binding protein [Pelolinea sp.]|nr:ATP-binding protein [Pelolinea sp.]
MKTLKFFRSHLNVKLFLFFIIIIIVLTIVLLAAVEIVMPKAFQNHMAFMSTYIVSEQENQQELDLNLFGSFRSAVHESLIFAIPFALLSALIISVSFSRQFINPIKNMAKVSKKIIAGDYQERIQISGNSKVDELDELKQLAVSFNQMTAKLERTEDLRKELIGDVSHELRTPLSLIKGSMEGLIDGKIPASSQTFYKIQQETDRLSKLVDDLQALSVIESGAYDLNKKKVEIHEVISSVVQIFSPRFERKGIQILDHFPKEQVIVNVDVDKITQVLTNILGNSLKFTPKGGLIEILGSNKEEHIQISIKASGIGISEEHLLHIFTRFYRVDKSRSRKSGGSGIGLTIAEKLIQEHGGEIWAESSGVNQGTTISFILPKI